MNKLSGVYQITFKGKIYVGSSVHIMRRWNEHKRHLRTNTHDNVYLQNAYNKYGESEFILKIVELVDDKTVRLLREQYWLNWVFENYATENIFNLSKSSAGNIGGSTQKQGHVEKVRLANLGKKRSDAFKQRMRDVKLGKPLSAQHKENIKRGMLGRVFSAETKERMQVAANKRLTKWFMLVSPDGVIYEFQNVTQFAKDFNLSRECLRDLLAEKQKSHRDWIRL